MEEKLISQYFLQYDNYQSLVTGKNTQSAFAFNLETIVPEYLLKESRLFIIAEPGYGKTTLVRRLKTLISHNGFKCQVYAGADNDKIILEEDTKYVIYDALDEAKDVIPTFISVIEACKTHHVKLIVTNRTHYLSDIQHLLPALNFRFVKLLAFDDGQIANYMYYHLKKSGFDRDIIDGIIRNSKANSYNSILGTPRYLAEFIQYIKREDIQAHQVTSLKKTDLFDRIVYYKLDADNKKSDVNAGYLTRRVLERLALVMEIQGLNQISKEDFITFLDQTKSNISLIFLSTQNLDELLRRVMKPTKDILQFENAEIQEYLAAKELQRMGNRFQTVYDLMIDQKLQIIRSNWIDVLNFAIDLEPQFARPIVNFIVQRKFLAVDERLVQILLSVSPEYFDLQFRDHLFEMLFDYYSMKGKVNYETYTQHSAFFSGGIPKFLTPLYTLNKLTDSVRHIQSNQILFIRAQSENGKLDNKTIKLWIKYLVSLAKRDELYSIHPTVLYTLVSLNAKAELLGLIEEFEDKEDYILNNLVYSLGEIAADCTQTIELIIRCLIQRRRVENVTSVINSLKKPEHISQIFQTVTKYLEILELNEFKYGLGFYPLFETIKAAEDLALMEIIEAFLLKLLQAERYIYQLSNFVKLSIKYVISNHPVKLKQMLELTAFNQSLKLIVPELVMHWDLQMFKIIDDFLIQKKSEWQLREVVFQVKHKLENHKEHTIYQFIQWKYLEKWAKEPKEIQIKKQKTAIEKLREYYESRPEYYHAQLIPDLVHKFEELKSELTANDVKYLTHVIKMVLNTYDPEKFKINIHSTQNDQTSFSHNHDTWFHIELYFKAAYLLTADDILSEFRLKFLKTIPRLDIFERHDEEFIKGVVARIGGLSAADVQLIYDYCSGRKDDLLPLSGRSFAETAVKLELKALAPVIAKLIHSPKIKGYDRESLTRSLGKLSYTAQDKKALEIIFLKYSATKTADFANGALISVFRDEQAISWRFKELKNRARPFIIDFRYSGTRGVSSFEQEMDDPEFPICFYGVGHPSIKKGMFDLLNYSFELRSDREYFKYSDYLQSTVQTYFQGFLNSEIIADLRQVANAFKLPDQTISFNTNLDKMVTELHLQQYQPETFLVAVRSANEVISRSYLPIQSNQELKELIYRVFNTEIRNLIEQEGFYHVADQLTGKVVKRSKIVNEELIQKTLKIALSKALLENGLRKSDIHREVESIGGLKYDYLITYGLFGPIVIELKLMHNSEIQNQKRRQLYKSKLRQYLAANTGNGIYAIFQVYEDPVHTIAYNLLLDEYEDIEGLDIISFKCYNQLLSTVMKPPAKSQNEN